MKGATPIDTREYRTHGAELARSIPSCDKVPSLAPVLPRLALNGFGLNVNLLEFAVAEPKILVFPVFHEVDARPAHLGWAVERRRLVGAGVSVEELLSGQLFDEARS